MFMDLRDVGLAVLGGIAITNIYIYLSKACTFPLKVAEDCATNCLNDGDIGPVEIIAIPFTFPAVSYAPSCSKLILYCRLAGVPFKLRWSLNTQQEPVSSMVHCGNVIKETQLAIRYIEQSFDITKMSTSHKEKRNPFICFDRLSESQQAHCDLIRILCEGIPYWSVISIRWLGAAGIFDSEAGWLATTKCCFGFFTGLKSVFLPAMFRTSVVRDAYAHGFARHSPADQLFLAKRALRSLSQFLGSKQFFLGDFPCECDCAAFGVCEALLEPACWAQNPLSDFMRKDCGNLVTFVSRLKQAFFADFSSGQPFPPAAPNGKWQLRN